MDTSESGRKGGAPEQRGTSSSVLPHNSTDGAAQLQAYLAALSSPTAGSFIATTSSASAAAASASNSQSAPASIAASSINNSSSNDTSIAPGGGYAVVSPNARGGISEAGDRLWRLPGLYQAVRRKKAALQGLEFIFNLAFSRENEANFTLFGHDAIQ